MVNSRSIAFAFAALLSGCVLDDVSLQDLACPCAEGWSCDPVTDRCVRGDAGGEPDGGADAGRDAGRDGGSPDAGSDGGGEDSGPMDAGMDADIDGGTPDAGADAGSDAGGLDDTVCGELSPTPLFCDGFEVGLAPWTPPVEIDGTVATVAEAAYRGTAGLLAETTAASGRASVRWTSGTAVTSGPLHARAYVYVPSFAVSGVSMLYLGEDAAPYQGIAVQVSGDDTGQVYNAMAPGIATGGTSTPFPRDRWVCVTLDLEVGDAGSLRATVDGTVIADQSPVDTLPDAGMASLIVGIEYTPMAQTSAEVRVDEVVVSTSPIPCD